MNELLDIIPGKSIGSYLLGMTRQKVWKQNRYPINCFYKSKDSIHRVDDIELLGIHVHYDKNETCNFIEAWTPVKFNNPTLQIKGNSLNGLKMRDIQSLCNMLPFSFKRLDSGFESRYPVLVSIVMILNQIILYWTVFI